MLGRWPAVPSGWEAAIPLDHSMINRIQSQGKSLVTHLDRRQNGKESMIHRQTYRLVVHPLGRGFSCKFLRFITGNDPSRPTSLSRKMSIFQHNDRVEHQPSTFESFLSENSQMFSVLRSFPNVMLVLHSAAIFLRIRWP